MNVKLIIIDQPIHINDNDIICEIWRKSLWAKVQGYQLHYNNPSLTVGGDDFFGTHLIAVNQMPNGQFEPLIMLKSVRLSQYTTFNTPFHLNHILKGAGLDNSLIIKKMLNSKEEVSYHSSFTVNPNYLKHPDKKNFKDYIALLLHRYYVEFNIKQWVAIAALKYKVDNYLQDMGAEPIHEEFKVLESDYEPVQLFHQSNATITTKYIDSVLSKYKHLNTHLQIFKPEKLEPKILIKPRAA